MIKEYDVAIIGAGPVGLFAVFEAGMLGMKSCVIDILSTQGGQCSALYPEKPIYDIPAYPKILAGELIDKLIQQSKPFSPDYYLAQQVMSFEKLPDSNKFCIKTNKDVTIIAKVIIIAAGAGAFGPNKPPITNIDEFEDKSVFYYVKNKDYFFGKKIAIAGGGDSAIDWAISLSDIAEKIYLIHRRDKFRAAPASMEKIRSLNESGKIDLVIPYQLKSLKGENGILEEIELYDLDSNKITIDANILLAFFGLSMNLGPIREWNLSLENSHILVDKTTMETNVEGVYAVGDVATYKGKLKLILTGFAEAAAAMHHSYSRVFDGKALHFEYSTSKKIGL